MKTNIILKNIIEILEIWKILNNVIRNGSRQNNNPMYFIDNDTKNENMEEIANS